MKRILAVVLGVALLAGSPVWAGGKGQNKAQREERKAQKEERKAQKEERKAFHESRKAERKAFQEQRKAENKAARDALKGTSGEERKTGLQEIARKDHDARKAFLAKQHEENMAFLKGKLAGNSRLSDAEKQELITCFETHHQEQAAFREARYQDRVTFFTQIANDPNLSQEQRKEKIREFMATQRDTNIQHQKDRHQERRDLFEKFQAERKAREAAGSTASATGGN